MSYRWISFWLVSVLAVGSVSAAVTNLGDYPDGTHYSYSFSTTPWTSGAGNATQTMVAWLYPAGGTAGPSNELFTVDFSGQNAGTSYHNYSLSVETRTGTFTVPPGATWTLRFQSYYQNNGSWAISYDSYSGTAGTGPDPLRQISWQLPANTGENPITWQVVDSMGNVVGYTVTNPGDPERVWTVDNLPSDAERDDYTLKFFMPGLKFDTEGGMWVSVTDPGSGSPGTATVNNSTVPTSGTGSGAAIPMGTTPTSSQIAIVPTPTFPKPPIKSTGGAIWNATGTTAGVSDAVYKEGVDKIVAQLSSSRQVSDRILTAKGSGDSATAGMGAAGGAAKSQAEALFAAAPSGPGYTLSVGGAPNLSVSMPSSFGGGTFNFNPFTEDRLGPVASWFRTAMLWLTVATLGVWIWKELGQWVRGLASVQQAKGNPVVGGTGAQATALVAAGLMTTAIVVAMTALLAWSFGELNVSSFVASATTNPLVTIPTGALWMLDQLFPVATMVTALVARVTFNLYASTVYAGCAAVVRFIVP